MVRKILCAPDWNQVQLYAEAEDVPQSRVKTEYTIVTGPEDLPKIQGLNRHETEVVLINGGPKMTWDEWQHIRARSIKFLDGKYTSWRSR